MNTQKKYSIQAKLDKLSYDDRKKALKEIPELLGIGRTQFYNIRHYEINRIGAIDSDKLLIIADYFGCPVDELLNKQEEAA